MIPSLRFKLWVALCVLAICGLATAQDPSSDPPGRVARLQFIDGEISLQPGGVDDWVAANLNRPLTTADRLWTDADSRAEVSMASTVLRMGGETSITLTNLNDQTTQIEVDQGTLELTVRTLDPDEVIEVDTPNFAYSVHMRGRYRFDVLPDQDQTWITVWFGDGGASGQSASVVRIHGGEKLQFTGGQSLTYSRFDLPESDGFDRWATGREQRELRSASAGYVAPGTIGYEDLDDNGYWEPSATYGTVWYPRVHAGWAPYREGHWAWVEPWGWTWVDDAPWGFAPFHYGRWVNDNGRWGWIPGPVGVRPVYAPALVAWVGGASFGASIGVGGGGGVGWFALGWHDPYLPSYQVSAAYARNVNLSSSKVVNITTVNNYYTTTNVTVRNTTINNITYENSKVNGAVTAVPSNAFASGQPVAKVAVVVPVSAVGKSSMMTSSAVVPTKAAVLGGHAPAAAPAHIVAPRQVVSKVAPPPHPVSFEQQRPLLEKSNGVPLTKETRSDLRKANPAPAKGTSPSAGNPQGGRTGTIQPGGSPTGRPPATPQPAGNQPVVHAPAANVPATPHAGDTGKPAQSGQNAGGDKTVAPTHTAAPPAAQPPHNVAPGAAAPGRTATPPATPTHPAAPPAGQQAAPAAQPQHNAAPGTATPPPNKTTPPAKEKKDKDKEKDKDPKGH